MSHACPAGHPHRHPSSVTEGVHWTLREVIVAFYMTREAQRRGWIR